MNIYIWQDVSHVSTRYHDGGGLVIVAKSLDAALALAKTHETLKNSNVYKMSPDVVYPLADVTEKPHIIVFPDAGCC